MRSVSRTGATSLCTLLTWKHQSAVCPEGPIARKAGRRRKRGVKNSRAEIKGWIWWLRWCSSYTEAIALVELDDTCLCFFSFPADRPKGFALNALMKLNQECWRNNDVFWGCCVVRSVRTDFHDVERHDYFIEFYKCQLSRGARKLSWIINAKTSSSVQSSKEQKV